MTGSGDVITANANLKRTGYPHLTSDTGGTLDIKTGKRDPGFNPVDLMLSSLAACLAMSARIAAYQLGHRDRFEGISVDVMGTKSDSYPQRITRFDIRYRFAGDMPEEYQSEIMHLAESLCTVSNTFLTRPEISIVAAGPAQS